jgi:hypothetical protein
LGRRNYTCRDYFGFCGEKRKSAPALGYGWASPNRFRFELDSFFAATAERSWAICMLDSEDDGCAEQAYLNDFKISLNDAVHIARNDSYRGNIRFYAAFRAADLLVAAKDERKVAAVLESVESASSIHTDFFGTNSLTSGYFTPGNYEGPFSVADLIRRRMQDVRGQKT